MFVNGISVVICGSKSQYHASTIAWATKIEKNHLIVSLPVDAAVTGAIDLIKEFSVSVLAENQSNVARQYGGRKQIMTLPRNKDDIDYSFWNVPTVVNCRARALCKVMQQVKLLEQVVLIAEIKDSKVNEQVEPLVYDHAEYFERKS